MAAGQRCTCGLKTVPVTIFVVVFVLLLNQSEAAPRIAGGTPDYILPCKRSDPQINSCIKKGFNHLRQYLKKGIPEINLPSLDPFLLDNLAVNNWEGPMRIQGLFKNITAYGPANYTVDNVRADVKSYIIDLGVHLPYIEATGKYNISGQVLVLPIRSRGEFWAAFSDIKAVVRVYGREVVIDGERYMKTEKLATDFDLRKARFRIKDTLNHNNVLGQAMNQFLNQNALEVIEEVKPVASKVISNYAKMIMNKAFLKVPISMWLLDE